MGTFRWSFPCPSLAGGLGDVAAVTDGYEKGLAVVVEISVRETAKRLPVTAAVGAHADVDNRSLEICPASTSREWVQRMEATAAGLGWRSMRS